LSRLVDEHSRVPSAQATRFDLSPGPRPNINEQLMNLRQLLFVLFSQMGRGISDDSHDRPMIPEKSEALPPSDCPIASPDPVQVDKTVIGDVLDH
jgi:hypothetical protein